VAAPAVPPTSPHPPAMYSDEATSHLDHYPHHREASPLGRCILIDELPPSATGGSLNETAGTASKRRCVGLVACWSTGAVCHPGAAHETSRPCLNALPGNRSASPVTPHRARGSADGSHVAELADERRPMGGDLRRPPPLSRAGARRGRQLAAR
jgi:hypothetical protein